MAVNKEKVKERYCVEMCPGCGNEQVIYTTGITPCPDCGYPIAPCVMCESCDYQSCPYGCDGTESDSKKAVTRPMISRRAAAMLYPYL